MLQVPHRWGKCRRYACDYGAYGHRSGGNPPHYYNVSVFPEILCKRNYPWGCKLGPYTLVREGLKPLNMSAGDFDLAVAPDGKAYYYFERVHSETICADLTSDYTDVTGNICIREELPHGEPVIKKADGIMPGSRAKERENRQVVFRVSGGELTLPVGIPSDVTVRLAVGTVALAVPDAFFQTVTGTFFAFPCGGIDRGAIPGQSPVKVMVFTNCQEVELLLNGKSIEKKQCDKYQQVSFQVPYEPGVLEAVGYMEGKAAEDRQRTAGEVRYLRLQPSKKCMIADGIDAVAINVYAVDEVGTVVPDADNLVRFRIEGGARILGVGNGDPNSHESEIAAYRKLFHGCAQVIIGNSGTKNITAVVYGDGIESAVLEILVIGEETIPYIRTVKVQVLDGWQMFGSLYDSMPDLDFSVTENDMNSYEPVIYERAPQSVFDNQFGKYGVYRVVPQLKKQKQSLYFGKVMGDVWVYMDGQLLAERVQAKNTHLNVRIPETAAGQHVIMVVVKNIQQEWSRAGICTPVTLNQE